MILAAFNNLSKILLKSQVLQALQVLNRFGSLTIDRILNKN
jgi:hypothetical protein